MIISWKWLAEIIDLQDVSYEQLATALTMAGFEIEKSTYINEQEDLIIDISSTTNRADTSSLIGIAREVSTLVERPMQESYNQYHLELTKQYINHKNEELTGRLITKFQKLHINISPTWLRTRLSQHDIKESNNIEDILAFIKIKWNHSINITYVNSHEHYKTLFNSTDTCTKNDNIINKVSVDEKDTEQPKYAVLYTDTSQQTVQKDKPCKTYLSTFNSNNDIFNAYCEAITLITHLCRPNKVSKTVYLQKIERKYPSITFNRLRAEQILGFTKSNKNNRAKSRLTENDITQIFLQLSFIVYKRKYGYHVKVPFYRTNDIKREIDLVEEVSRIHGFDNFVDYKFTNNYTQYQSSNVVKCRLNQIRQIMRSIGFHEVVHSSLTNSSTASIYNPLNKEYSSLRNNIIEGLLQSNSYNLKQSKSCFEVFEIGKVFHGYINGYNENMKIGCIMGGPRLVRNRWTQKPSQLNWFQAKGDLEELFERLEVNATYKKLTEQQTDRHLQDYFVSKRSCSIWIHRQCAGIFGEIACQNNNITIPNQTYGFELDLNYLVNIGHNMCDRKFKPYTKYPSIVRDINVQIKPYQSVEEVFKILSNVSCSYITSINLFDVYESKQENNCKKCKNLSFRITYSRYNSTLTNEEVDHVEDQLKNHLKQLMTS
uniref:phenylalanine--tRNA ligase n=1 Tax=Yamadaella caenomyce TaxID=259029 RepID=A0A1G4NYX1_9FLOR|nr:Phenylalanine-tRNA ligase beta subunit [Yamadaella caenomyce]SCW23891.1 Phenylalanine-tRNA ligase beta subunit [Yamadaella caenomyce]